MLAGIGGRTIEEAKERLSYAEVLDWIEYRRQYGPLNLGYRLEWILAQVAYTAAAASGAKSKSGKKLALSDFLMFIQKRSESEDEEVSLEALARLFGVKT